MKIPQERIDHATRYMKEILATPDGADLATIGQDAQTAYLTGLLICNDAGVFTEDELLEASFDGGVQLAVAVVAARLGWLGTPGPFERYP